MDKLEQIIRKIHAIGIKKHILHHGNTVMLVWSLDTGNILDDNNRLVTADTFDLDGKFPQNVTSDEEIVFGITEVIIEKGVVEEFLAL